MAGQWADWRRMDSAHTNRLLLDVSEWMVGDPAGKFMLYSFEGCMCDG